MDGPARPQLSFVRHTPCNQSYAYICWNAEVFCLHDMSYVFDALKIVFLSVHVLLVFIFLLSLIGR